MMRLLAVAALGAGLICVVSNGVAAQPTAPIGHRQATAAAVADETALAPVPHKERRSASRRLNRKRSNRHHAQVGFPDICSNCNN